MIITHHSFFFFPLSPHSKINDHNSPVFFSLFTPPSPHSNHIITQIPHHFFFRITPLITLFPSSTKFQIPFPNPPRNPSITLEACHLISKLDSRDSTTSELLSRSRGNQSNVRFQGNLFILF